MTDPKVVHIKFGWTGDLNRLNELLKPLGKALETLDLPKIDVDLQSTVEIAANYSSIEPVRSIVEPWIDAWGGDEWGESMRALHSAGQVDYGLDDEDCARVMRILWKNLDAQKDWMDIEGHEYGLNDPEVQAEAAKRACEARDYWLKGGNLGVGKSAEIAKATIDSLPTWLFEA